MVELGQVVQKIRSKNAGPFWLTIDIFCGSELAFKQVTTGLSNHAVAAVFGMEPTAIKRFDIASLNVVKFSLPRPETQGAIHDRDMHGASWAALFQELKLA
ncbi:MAG: DUF4387 domain-containing protein [Rhodobacteraceae bacterium]|nr:DUF4387 domain-containing protein [Paracoccaceae bacterium]